MTTQDRAAELAKEYQIIRDNIFNDMGNRPAGWKDFPIEKAVEWINVNVEAFRRLIAAHPELIWKGNEADDEGGCMDCGAMSELDIVLTRKQWLMINPDDGGILCANCIIKRASKIQHVVNLQGYISFASDYDGENKTNFACKLMEKDKCPEAPSLPEDWEMINKIFDFVQSIIAYIHSLTDNKSSEKDKSGNL